MIAEKKAKVDPVVQEVVRMFKAQIKDVHLKWGVFFMNMREMQRMQQKLMKMQEELENTNFTVC